MWPDGTYPILFAESSCVCMPSFRSVAPFFSKMYHFFLIWKGVWPYRHAHDAPMVTPILNIYIWVRGSRTHR